VDTKNSTASASSSASSVPEPHPSAEERNCFYCLGGFVFLGSLDHDGEEVVVKLEMPPYGSFAGEVRTLLAAEGRRYARLLDLDEGRHAMLQERLGPSLCESGVPVPARVEILCATLRSAWEMPVPPGLQAGAEKARWLSGFIAATWEELGRPCSRSVVERALAFAEDREAAFDPAASVLVHGDAHDANALRAPGPTRGRRARDKLVDPDGLLAEPAYDLGILMRGSGAASSWGAMRQGSAASGAPASPA